MKKLILLVAIVAAIYGYYKLSPREQQHVIETGKSAADVTGKVFTSAYNGVLERVRDLDAQSSKDDLHRAEKDLETAKAKAKKGEANKETIDHLQAELDRIRAAVNVQEIKKQIDERVAIAAKAKENAERSLDEVKDRLHKADGPFRLLQARLVEAQKAYDAAASRFKSKSD